MDNNIESFSVRESEPNKEDPDKKIAFVFSNDIESGSETQELNDESRSRLDKALELYNEDKIDKFVLVGGQFHEGLDRPISELMKKYLQDKGMSSEVKIETEEFSVDTVANILIGFIDTVNEFSDEVDLDSNKTIHTEKIKEEFRNIIENRGINFISSEYHLNRIKEILQENDLLPENMDNSDFVAADGFQSPEGVKNKLVELIAKSMLWLEPNGLGGLHKKYREKLHNKR